MGCNEKQQLEYDAPFLRGFVFYEYGIIRMLKLTIKPYHFYLETNNGAGFSIPIEVVKGIQDGSIDDQKYYQAAEFLSGEGQEYIDVETIKTMLEREI